jgi:hypothetical protein
LFGLGFFDFEESSEGGLLMVLDVFLSCEDVGCDFLPVVVVLVRFFVFAFLGLFFQILFFGLVLFVLFVFGFIEHFLQFFFLLDCLFFLGLLQSGIFQIKFLDF